MSFLNFGIFGEFPELTAAFSTRSGGVSPYPYKSLNLGLSTDDDPVHVAENRSRFFNALDISGESIVMQNQIHCDEVQRVSSAGTYKGTDACFTDKPGLFLTVQTADCVPIFIYEPNLRICAIIHAGWRGTAKNIAAKTINAISREFERYDLEFLAAVGPSISAENYEVDEKVASNFDASCLVSGLKGKSNLDLVEANCRQLKKAGVHNIEASGLCTYHEKELFYSHRRDGGMTGRMMGVIGLRQS